MDDYDNDNDNENNPRTVSRFAYCCTSAALLAETLGIHFILGAFLAGLFFVHRTIDPGVSQALRARIAG